MNFVAIDFETATARRDSACSMAMVVVENSIIVAEHYILIQPPYNEYNYINTNIHGLDFRDTINEPTIEGRYQLIYDVLHGANIVAHNASFDMSVLKASLGYHGLDLPIPASINCTYRLTDAKLSVCCSAYNIELNHHNALSDATACAKLFLILDALGIKPKPKAPRKPTTKKPSLQREAQIGDAILNKDTIFNGKSILITGKFDNYERSEIADAVQRLGGSVKSSLSKNVDILICGTDCGPAKLAKVMQLKEDGIKDILVVTEDYLNGVL